MGPTKSSSGIQFSIGFVLTNVDSCTISYKDPRDKSYC